MLVAVYHSAGSHINWSAAAAAKSLQSCPTLCDSIDGSTPGSPVPGILQARTLEWVAISFSSAWKGKWKWSCSVVSDSLRPHGLQPTRLLHPWDFPGKSTGVGWHCLLELHYYNHWSYIELYIWSTASSLVIISVEGSVIYLVIQEIIIWWNKQNTNGIVNNIRELKVNILDIKMLNEFTVC